jgi:hypothetical protein
MNNVPCAAYLDEHGKVHNGCGEPCSWVMRKIGYGDPPWRIYAVEEAAAAERAAVVWWLRRRADDLDETGATTLAMHYRVISDAIERGDHASGEKA